MSRWCFGVLVFWCFGVLVIVFIWMVWVAQASTLNGGDYDDQMVGFQGNDRINAGSGDDVIVGGYGKDTISGGAGRDIFLYYNVEESYRTADGS
ncbi:hypothetical protein V2I59_02900 [Pseudomonas viridiflava]|uniref:M10 family metallopeptidase C-terminal domain-containing protein n=1 Tax=Pseudomonas viridiflava TaxID=33069 RepID=UPI002EC76ADD|nr:hypothetical protein [Pseudomonas viridiflava]